MQLNVDVRQQVPQTAGSPEASQPWILGQMPTDDGLRSTSRMPPYSFLGECECPDDCPRDHENE